MPPPPPWTQAPQAAPWPIAPVPIARRSNAPRFFKKYFANTIEQIVH